MQTVLEQGSIDKPLTFDVGLIQLSFKPVCSLNIYMQHFSQIVRRVCTLVLSFVIITNFHIVIYYFSFYANEHNLDNGK